MAGVKVTSETKSLADPKPSVGDAPSLKAILGKYNAQIAEDVMDGKSGRDFTADEIVAMRANLRDGRAPRDQVWHCLDQLTRFALETKDRKGFCALQFGFNLGRVQEILQPCLHDHQKAGRDCWWRRYEALAGVEDYDGIVKLTEKIRSSLVVAWN
jgi:hypothetical protein